MPVPPAVAVQITRLFAANASAPQLAEVIGTDPALASEILTVANGQHQTAGANITTLTDAIEILGQSAVHSLVMTQALVHLTRNDPTQWRTTRSSASANEFVALVRTRCIVNAVVSTAVAELICPELVDDVFLASLLGAVGHYVVAAQAPSAYSSLVDRGGGWPDSRHVVAALGLGLDEITAQLLRSWSMPDLLTTAIHRRSGSADASGLADERDPRTIEDQFATILRLGLLAENAIFSPADASALSALLRNARRVPKLDLLTLSEVLVAADEMAGSLSSDALGTKSDDVPDDGEQRPFGDRLRGELLEDELGILPTAGAVGSV